MSIGANHGGNDPYPVGAIIMWTGDIEDIPYGWEFCDGTNGTPDLRNRFIRGINTTTTEPGATGGTNNFKLTEAQIPSHSHTASTSADGQHNHQLDKNGSGAGGPGYGTTGIKSGGTAQSNTTGDHTHTASVGNTGGSGSIDNRPQYVEVAFIQKLDSSNL